MQSMSSEFDTYARGLYGRTPRGPFKSFLREAISTNQALLDAEAHRAAMLITPQSRSPLSEGSVLERHRAIAGSINDEVLGDLPDDTLLKDAFPSIPSPVVWEGFFSKFSRASNPRWSDYWQKLGRGDKIIIGQTFLPLIEIVVSDTPPYATNPNYSDHRRRKAKYHMETMSDLRSMTLDELTKAFGLLKGTVIFEASKKK